MACTEPGAIVAVEVFVEQNVVAPVRVALKTFRCRQNGTAAICVAEKDPGETLCYSPATSNRFISRPEPVGHSILKRSP